jgi:hypothetical protein
VLEGLAYPNKKAELLGKLDEWGPELQRTGDTASNLWDALAPADAAFTRLIVGGGNADAIRQVARDYRSAAIRFGTPVKLRSVREHLALVALILEDQGKHEEAQAVAEIRNALG